MGGFGIQLKCAHKMKSMNMFHVLQKLTKNIQSKIFVKWWRGRQLFSDQWVKCWTTGTKQSWWTQSNLIYSNSKSASLSYLKSLTFSIDTSCFRVRMLSYYCTLTAIYSLRGNELVFVCKCESLPLSCIELFFWKIPLKH